MSIIIIVSEMMFILLLLEQLDQIDFFFIQSFPENSQHSMNTELMISLLL